MNVEFLGGPPHLFERAGREQAIVLLEHGLTFQSTVLDIGCGALRGGRWIIPLLEPGYYCGIEPQRQLVEQGLREFVDPEILALKRPRFDYNDRFDFSVFGMEFTHFLARSIWTHASKPQIEQMLDGFCEWGTQEARFLASLIPSSSLWFLRPARRVLRRIGQRIPKRDYKGESWVGGSHKYEGSGMVAHSIPWLHAACRTRGLEAKLLRRPPINGGGQIWALVRRA
jgi:SAM-dependent methyltransferase